MTIDRRRDAQYDFEDRPDRLRAIVRKAIDDVNGAMNVPAGEKRHEYLTELFKAAPDFATVLALQGALIELVAVA